MQDFDQGRKNGGDNLMERKRSGPARLVRCDVRCLEGKEARALLVGETVLGDDALNRRDDPNSNKGKGAI